MANSKLSLLSLVVFGLFFMQCTKGGLQQPATTGGPGANSGGPPPTPEWLIPQASVFDGGPGKDGIPSISSPFFITAEEATFLDNNDLVLGIKVGDDIRAYPHPILDWHEIVNDRIGDLQVAITYCPLTGTGVGWDRTMEGEITSFGVSGLLYNTNLIPYDRRTDSNWSQMLLKCVNGEMIGTKIKTHQLVETSWKTWKTIFPETKVMSTQTGYNRNYDRYPYGNYRTNHESLFFPVEFEDNRLPWKERVLGVILGGDAKAYRFENFPESGVGVVNDGFAGMNIVVAGSRNMNFMVAFKRSLKDGQSLTFRPVEDALPVVMTDQEGNMWNIFGEAISGPRTGTQLPAVDAFIGYWVAWGAFYPDLRYR